VEVTKEIFAAEADCAVIGCLGNNHKLLYYLQRSLIGVQDKNLGRQPLTVDLTTEKDQEKCTSTPSAVSSDNSTRPSPALVHQLVTEGSRKSTDERSHTVVAFKASEAPNFVEEPACRRLPFPLLHGK